MTYVPELKQAYYADKGSNILKALDSIGKPHHQHEFLDPYFVEGQHVAVHTVAYIPGRYLVVFCSDHSVNLMKEVKNRRGCTHGYHSEAKVMHQLMHRKLMWEPCFQKLISVGSDNHLYEWEASTPSFIAILIVDEIAVGAKRIHLQPEHCNTITDIVCIAEKELVVTSSLDRRVCVWQMPTWKLRAMFRDHTLGVQALSYLRGTLLSAGFDWEIIAWDADRLEKIGTMNGHKSPITAVAQMVCPTNYEDMKAVSADCNYEIRVWDLSGCIAGGNTIPCLMVFRLPHLAGAMQGPKQIFLPFDQELSVKGYSNMLVATHNVISYAARKIKKEFFVPPAAEFNASSAHFLSALRRNVHIWDATSGEYIRKLIDVSPSADIVSACFALPFERRLILGTEDGKLLLVNYVTGAILDETQPHSAEVTQMAYCKATKMIISADYHGSVVITSEIQCKLKELQVLGFQHLDYVAAVVQSVGEPSTGLVFLDRYSIIALGDLTRVCLWHLDMETFKVTCFAKLSVPAETVGLSLDVLNSIGVLRMERSTATNSRSAESQQHDGDSAASPEAEVIGETGGGRDRGNSADSDQASKKRGDAAKKDRIPDNKSSASSAASATSSGRAKTEEYDEGEVWIALGTEGGRLACWALEDILESETTLMPDLKLRPVPDSLCPALRSSFNPYSLNVEPKKSSQAPPAFTPAATGVSRTMGSDSSSVDASGSGVAESDRGGDGNVAASGATGTSRLIGDTSFGDDDEDCSWRVPEASAPKAVWQGHSGAVSRIGSCSQPPCFFTLGEDGYQRTWSVEGKVLGQFALPNASEVHHKRRQVFLMIVAGTLPPLLQKGCVASVFLTINCKSVWYIHFPLHVPTRFNPSPTTNTPSCRLFRNIGWSFLVDTVRVRPLHEEMTAGLLDEVERRRAQKTSRRSTSSRGGSSFYNTVLDATSAAASAAAPPSPSATLAPQSVASGVQTAPFGSPVAGRAVSTPAAVGSHPSGAAATSSARPGDCEEKDLDAPEAGRSDHRAAAGKAVPEPNPLAVAAQRRTEAAAAAKRQVDAERRQAALATIEKHRSCHRAASARSPGAATTATVTSSGVNQEGKERLARDSSSAATTLTGHPISRGGHLGAERTAARKGNLSQTTMTGAFSAQSVRSGATLGYYGREEVNMLSAISKNPSRIAVYNRITEVKEGHNGGEDSPEITVAPVPSPHSRRPRTTPSSMRLSSSAPALSLGGEDSSLTRSTSSSSNGKRQLSATVLSPPPSTATGVSRAESGGGFRPAPLGSMIGPGVDFGLKVGVASEQPPPSRTVKMYRNAAREYGRGASAGQAMWMDLQRDVSVARTGARCRRDTHSGQRGGGSTRAAAGSDLSSGSTSTSTFPDLPQIGTTSAPENVSWAARDDTGDRPEGSDFDDSDDEVQAMVELEGGGVGSGSSTVRQNRGNVGGVASAANDWFAATRHGRDDAVPGGTRIALNRGPGWEDTYAFRRSTARRAIKTSRIVPGKRSTPWLSSAAMLPEKWNWDWCSRPLSALPADRIEYLLSKFDDELSAPFGEARRLVSSATLSVGDGSAVPIETASRKAEAGSAAEIAKTSKKAAEETETEGPVSPPSPTKFIDNKGDAASAVAAATAVVDDSAATTHKAPRGRRARVDGYGRDGEQLNPEPTHDGIVRNASGSGRAHLVSVEVQKRSKELVKLQQKIIALLVKGNDHARRREARDRQRRKLNRNPLAKGPRPGQLGPHYTLQAVMEFRAAFNFVDEDMSGCLDSEEWRRFLDRFKSNVAVINMRSMFLHLDKDMSGSVEVGELVPVIFNKASTAQHHLIRHLIEYENSMDVKRFGKHGGGAPVALQLEDAKRLFELHDPSNCGRLDQKTIRRMLLALRMPQLSWDAFARSTPRLQTAPRLSAEEFAAGFFEAFVL
ncbi:unnamed protein product [Ectocarpus fasciculatus]